MYPQRSVMTCGLATALEPPYFNHAPVWGATCPLRLWNMARTCFNPRTRVGCDAVAHGLHQAVHGVSIHAPAWGATQASAFTISSGRFQSTHPRGVRLLCQVVGFDRVLVSIHAPAWGATSSERRRPSLGRVSIHAPAWGATIGQDELRLMPVVSIHAPAWGATRR